MAGSETIGTTENRNGEENSRAGLKSEVFQAELGDIIESRKRRFELEAGNSYGSFDTSFAKLGTQGAPSSASAAVPQDQDHLNDLVVQIQALSIHRSALGGSPVGGDAQNRIGTLAKVKAVYSYAVGLLRGSADSPRESDEVHVQEAPALDLPAKKRAADLGLVGLALSGGGIRSSTYCFGALQALAQHAMLRGVDYLSTVSGGGYIGSCWSCVLQNSQPSLIERTSDRRTDAALFPFLHSRGALEAKPIQQLRDRARYLAPGGFLDYLRVPVFLLRGLLLNFLMIAKYLFLLAILTVLFSGEDVAKEQMSFLWTLCAAGLVAGILLLFTLYQSFNRRFGSAEKMWEFRRKSLRRGRNIFLLLVGIAVVESQPYAIVLLDQLSKDLSAFVPSVGNYWAGMTAGVGALAALFARMTGGTKAKMTHKITSLLASALVPVTLYLVYLMLCRWAILATGPFAIGGSMVQAPQVIEGTLLIHDWLVVEGRFLIEGQLYDPQIVGVGVWIIALRDWVLWLLQPVLWLLQPIEWLLQGALRLCQILGLLPEPFGWAQMGVLEHVAELAVSTYGLIFAALLILSPFFNPNIFSLHNLYRDSLSNTFLFGIKRDGDGREESLLHQDAQALHDLDVGKTGGPYHLINATVNDADLGDKNLRGRSSDFFVFSRHWTGNQRLGYCPTVDLEKLYRHVNLGTALAISAAAAAPNMGEKNVQPLLRLSLAILNVRLNYWLRAPVQVTGDAGFLARLFPAPPLYFLGELGWLPRSLTKAWINASDGGHIENLGIFELLRRKCRYIIAIDSEADPEMTFNGLAILVRLARTDLGIDVDIDLSPLKKDEKGLSERHWALGQIRYDEDTYGELLYIKASLTGDENNYINEYRSDHPSYPHQTTADQFFDETQFECYRALGYECANSLFRRIDREGLEEGGAESRRGIAGLFANLRRQLDSEATDDAAYLELQAQRAAIERRIYCEHRFASYASELLPDPRAADQDPCEPGPGSTGGGTREAQPARIDSVTPCLLQLVNEQLQLMERTAIGLQLTEDHNRRRPRNRGWMNLFRRWAESPTFRAYWAISISDYSASFQRFCAEALGLTLDVRWVPFRPQICTTFEQQYIRDVRSKIAQWHHRELPDDGLPSGEGDDPVPVHLAEVSAGTQARDLDGPEPTAVTIALAVVDRFDPDCSVLRAFRIGDTYRGMRLSEPLLRQLREQAWADRDAQAPEFWFGDRDDPGIEALERVLLRLGFVHRNMPEPDDFTKD